MLYNVFCLCCYLVLAKVMFDYHANEDDELSLRRGENVEVLAQSHKGWWTGSLNGKEGFFPSNYVKLEKNPISIPKPQRASVSIPPVREEPGELDNAHSTYIGHSRLNIKEVSGHLSCHLVKWLELSHL